MSKRILVVRLGNLSSGELKDLMNVVPHGVEQTLIKEAARLKREAAYNKHLNNKVIK